MTTYTTPETISEEYKGTARRYLQQADAEFERGDLLQASEKAWGAASQYVKALGTVRGLPHRDHRELRQIAYDLVDETGNGRIGELFIIAEGIHANFYEAWMRSAEVRARIDNVKEFLDLLESVPDPDGSNPVRPPRARLFFRDREDG